MHALLCCGVVQTAQTAGRRGCLKVVEHICQVLDSVSVVPTLYAQISIDIDVRRLRCSLQRCFHKTSQPNLGL